MVDIGDVMDIRTFLLHRDNGRLIEAEACAREILARDHENHLMWFEYGKILLNQKKHQQAILAFRTAVSLCKLSIGYNIFLGHSLIETGDALRSGTNGYCIESNFYSKGLAEHLIELFNIACDLKRSSYLDDAESCYRAAIACNGSNMFHAYYSLAELMLMKGRFEEATPLLIEWYKGSMAYNKNSLSFWKGESLEGKTLWVFNEHGLGDTIQFIRFVRIVAAQCKRVILTLPTSLWKIVGEIPNVVKQLEIPNHFDTTCSLFMLPHIAGIDPATLARTVPYLFVEPERVSFWKARLPRNGLRIGIAWQGNPTYVMEPERSIPLAEYAPLSRLPGVSLISLQMNHGLDQLDHLPDDMNVITLGPDFNAGPDNVVDTAAVMLNLDLIISSDTSVPHIAGALGCPAWVLLTAVSDWRWLLDREDSPWYPSMRLFRQTRPGDWADVMERVVVELSRLIAAR